MIKLGVMVFDEVAKLRGGDRGDRAPVVDLRYDRIGVGQTLRDFRRDRGRGWISDGLRGGG